MLLCIMRMIYLVPVLDYLLSKVLLHGADGLLPLLNIGLQHAFKIGRRPEMLLRSLRDAGTNYPLVSLHSNYNEESLAPSAETLL